MRAVRDESRAFDLKHSLHCGAHITLPTGPVDLDLLNPKVALARGLFDVDGSRPSGPK